MYKEENKLRQKGFRYIAGTDEAGRGPMAGPLVAAAVVLKENIEIPFLNDSKKLSEKKRLSVYDEIIQKAAAVVTTIIPVETVDQLNVYTSTKVAMESCIKKLPLVDYVLIDAVKLDLNIPNESIIRGDSKIACIAAASIVAKVTRDRYMLELDKTYPQYGFKNHKGYVTKQHLAAINQFGIINEHRKSFKPVQKVLNNND